MHVHNAICLRPPARHAGARLELARAAAICGGALEFLPASTAGAVLRKELASLILHATHDPLPSGRHRPRPSWCHLLPRAPLPPSAPCPRRWVRPRMARSPRSSSSAASCSATSSYRRSVARASPVRAAPDATKRASASRARERQPSGLFFQSPRADAGARSATTRSRGRRRVGRLCIGCTHGWTACSRSLTRRRARLCPSARRPQPGDQRVLCRLRRAEEGQPGPHQEGQDCRQRPRLPLVRHTRGPKGWARGLDAPDAQLRAAPSFVGVGVSPLASCGDTAGGLVVCVPYAYPTTVTASPPLANGECKQSNFQTRQSGATAKGPVS